MLDNINYIVYEIHNRNRNQQTNRQSHQAI